MGGWGGMVEEAHAPISHEQPAHRFAEGKWGCCVAHPRRCCVKVTEPAGSLKQLNQNSPFYPGDPGT